MPPYNIDIPEQGDTYTNNNRPTYGSYQMSSSPRRTTAAFNNRYGSNVSAPVQRVSRPISDMPSTSSSGSWANELFPRSHPRHNKPSGGSTIHPHIRELVERQNQIKQLQRQLNYDEQQQQQRQAVKELYYNNNNENKNNNVIHGLHMDHVLSNLDDNNSFLLPNDHNQGFGSVPVHQPYANHPLSPHLDGTNNQMLSPSHNYHSTAARLGNSLEEVGDYEIEGTFQSKGCVLQTADDVGYLFGCGTHPHDEVVYVYNSKPKQPEGPPTAVADERNLFYHTGPTKIDTKNNVNDVLFQIDKEYHAMQARAGGGHSEFLIRDPAPQLAAPHGQYNKVGPDDDDEYTKRSGCSISSLMDLLLPSKGRQSRNGTPILSPRKQHKQDVDDRGGYYADYPTESRYPLLCASPSRRKQRRSKHSNIFTSSESDEDSTFDKLNYKRIVKTASDSVHELQTQLKAMVHERAKNKVSSNKNQVDESRQEPSPPSSPTTKNDTEKEVDRLRQEQATLDSARKLLQAELAQHQVKMANMGSNPYYNNNGGMVGSPYSPPMMISPLSAPGQMGVQPMMVSNPAMNMQMNNGIGGMNMNNGLWPQQQQQGMFMNNGMMGMQSQSSGMNMMQQNTQASPPPQVVQPSSGLPQVPSNIGFGINAHDSKSIMSKSNNSFHGVNNHVRQQGKFIDNVGAGIGTTRSFLNHQGPQGGGNRAHLATRSYTDLKSKNESIRQDISKMKNMMNTGTWDTNKNSSSPKRSGGVRGTQSFQQQSGGRPFPRTSPPSSPGNKHWYGTGLHEEVEERIKRAMQRSDEARSARGGSSNGSVASGQQRKSSSPKQYNSRQGYQEPNRQRGDYSRRQPPSPIRTSRQRDQEYFHV